MPGAIALYDRLLIALGFRQAKPARVEPQATQDYDVVARHGLSYRDPADPISDEAHLEIERQKSFRRPSRRS